jgi:hypothetical protein
MATSRLPHKILLHQHNRNRRHREKKPYNIKAEQNSITAKPNDFDANLLNPDPFYYYDISSESESECDITPDIYRATSSSSGVDTLMDSKELQWVCCCVSPYRLQLIVSIFPLNFTNLSDSQCGKYNSLPNSHQYVTGHEVCADNTCQHNPCDQCQSIETTVCRRTKNVNREFNKKGKSRAKV